MGKEIIKRIDHLLVRVAPPDPLFAILKDQLLLPQAWPVTRNAFFLSGGIHLGNLNLDIFQLNQDPVEENQTARLYGVAFEIQPYEKSLPALRQRGIPHTPPMPFYQLDEQGWQIVSWMNVYLGGLFHSSPLASAFFRLSHHIPANTWEKATLPSDFNLRFGLPYIYNHVYPHGITYAVQYNPAWRGINIVTEPDHSGLDIKQVVEVTIGTNDFLNARECWKKLLQPYSEISQGIWQFPDGLRLRLKPAASDGLLHMVWQVHSLNRAVQFLHRKGMMGKEKKGIVRIDPDQVMGLDIRLVQ